MNRVKKGFLSGKGYYVVLFLCVLAVAVSGYVIFSGKDEKIPVDTEVLLEEPGETAAEEVSAPAAEDRTGDRKETEKTSAPVKEPAGEETKEVSALPAWTKPVDGEVSRSFSGDTLVYNPTLCDWRTHDGTDFACKAGSEVRAIGKGVVTAVREDKLTGVSVTVEHAGGYTAIYANLDPAVTVRSGDDVAAGEVVGKVGDSMKTETADAPHLHFEVMKSGKRIDPCLLFGG
ncbi:MAG: M23 family metallopeptidase [Clostridia bacterium]|nr:M23 family metallopeptidase [Clostridia bacterium]